MKQATVVELKRKRNCTLLNSICQTERKPKKHICLFCHINVDKISRVKCWQSFALSCRCNWMRRFSTLASQRQINWGSFSASGGACWEAAQWNASARCKWAVLLMQMRPRLLVSFRSCQLSSHVRQRHSLCSVMSCRGSKTFRGPRTSHNPHAN